MRRVHCSHPSGWALGTGGGGVERPEPKETAAEGQEGGRVGGRCHMGPVRGAGEDVYQGGALLRGRDWAVK